jgi:hypothetical protein
VYTERYVKTINKYIGKGLRREELGGVDSKRGGGEVSERVIFFFFFLFYIF